MRPRFLPLWTLVLTCWVGGALGQEPAPNANRSPEYVEAIRQALAAFSRHDYKTTIAMVDKAEKLDSPVALTVNLRAAVAIDERRYAEGRELCLKALSLDPKCFPALFNLAEIPFMQGKYAEARLAYEKLLEQQPKAELVTFRLFLTYLLEKNEAQAEEELKKIPMLNDGPIYFCAQAAWEFAHGNEKAGLSQLKSAEAVFPPSKVRDFIGVFYDLGWIPRPPVAE